MMPILANYIAPPGTGDWLSVAFYLVGLTAALAVIYKQFVPSQIRPQPLQVSGTVRMATYDELHQLRCQMENCRLESIRRFESIERKIEQHQAELMQAGDVRKTEIFDRINTIHDDINERIGDLGLKQSNDIGELRGELRRIK